MRRTLLWSLPLLHIAGHTLGAADQATGKVEVHLKDGETVLGLLVGEDTDSVTVRRTMRSRSGTATADIHYQRTDLDEVTDLVQAYQDQAAKTGKSLTAQLTLAHWCSDRELPDQAATHALAALAIDRANVEARTLLLSLGYLRVKGQWVKEEEYLDSHGLARYLDKIYSSADRQAITAHQAQLAAELNQADKQKGADRLQAFIALDQASLAADKKRSEDLDADIKDKTTKLTAAQKQADDDQKKLDAANKAVAAAKTGRRSLGPSETTIDAQKQAQQTETDDKTAISDLQKQIDKDKQLKADLVTHDQHLTEEIDAQIKQASMVSADVTTATAEVDKARKNTDAVIARSTPVILPEE